MTRHEPTTVPEHINARMFAGPARLRVLMPALRGLPPSVAEAILAVLAVGEGVLRGRRYRQAVTWAAAQGKVGRARHRMAVALLANHGRFVAAEAMLGVRHPSDLARDVVIEGAGHLRACASGAILLGFHLGPPRTWLTLRALGYPVRFAGRLESARRDPRWRKALAAADVIRLPDGDPRERLLALHRIRSLLRDGGMVYLTADGPFGREAFRVGLPGGPLIVRAGWLALRRHSEASTLPVFVHRDGRRRVIVVHPPLPAADPDPTRDADLARGALTPLLEEYVRRFPAQCRYLALPRWSADASGAPGGRG